MTEERIKEIAAIISHNIACGISITGALVFLYLFEPPLWVMWWYVPFSVVLGIVFDLYLKPFLKGGYEVN